MKSQPNQYLQRRSLDRNVSLSLSLADVVDRQDVSIARGDQDTSRPVRTLSLRSQRIHLIMNGTIAQLNHSPSGQSASQIR
jgi:hypothetical protein